jgi:hypothetical protein
MLMSSPFRKTALALALAGVCVPAIAQVSINEGLDGNWYTAGAGGRGVAIDVLPRPDGGAHLYGVLFTYDAAGKPTWLSFLGNFEQGDNVIENVDLFRHEGGRFDSPTPSPTGTVVGKVSIDVSSCASLGLTLALDASSGLPNAMLDVSPGQINVGFEGNPLCRQLPVLTQCPTGTTAEGNDCLLPNSITGSLYLPAGKKYLVKGAVIVEAGGTLTIDPGVTVQGHSDTAVTNWIGVKQDGRIYAEGTADRPIVFTGPSAEIGSWGGMHIAGRSTCNDYVSEAEPCRFEAYPEMVYGGNKGDDNSGVLRYVRIEWAGALTPFANQEFNSLSLLGVGAGTTIEYVQVDGGKDDGFEWFGGNVNARHLVCSNMADDCFDLDDGYHGKLQFLLAWQGVNTDIGNDSNGIESDNSNTAPDILPRTRPEISNITLVGSADYSNLHGMRIRRGSGGLYTNAVVTGYTGASVALDGAQTWALDAENLSFTHSFVGHSGAGFFGGNAASAEAVATWFNAFSGNQTGDAKLIDYLPQDDSPVLIGGKALAHPYFRPVSYRGAFAGMHDDWTRGWTSRLPR